MKINWIKIYNYSFGKYSYILIGYYPGVENTIATKSAVPYENVTPEKVTQHFPQLVGQTANDKKEIGKILCFIINNYTANPPSNICEYIGTKQGFNHFGNNNYLFSPPHILYDEIKQYLNKGMLSRQRPYSCSKLNDDLSKELIPLFKDKRELQILLSAEVPVALPVALLKNTRYDSLDAPPIGSKINPLKFDLESVNDGVAVAIDVFSADQLKKGEKGYDLMISDTAGAKDNGNGAHHISALISGYADLYIPKEVRCVMKFDEVSTEYSVEVYKTALKRLDENVIVRTELWIVVLLHIIEQG